MKKEIEELIYNFIGRNYGSQEMEEPCYNIKLLSKEITDYLKKKGCVK